jgi:hypothetical protein
MPTFPQGPLRTALYDVLTPALSVPVVVQRQPEGDTPAPLVMIETPPANEWGDFKNLLGYEAPLRIRVHTRYPKGKADLSKREELAESVEEALRSSELALDGYALRHLPFPDAIPQTYESGGEQAYDLILAYDLDLQPTE